MKQRYTSDVRKLQSVMELKESETVYERGEKFPQKNYQLK